MINVDGQMLIRISGYLADLVLDMSRPVSLTKQVPEGGFIDKLDNSGVKVEVAYLSSLPASYLQVTIFTQLDLTGLWLEITELDSGDRPWTYAGRRFETCSRGWEASVPVRSPNISVTILPGKPG